MELNIQQNKLLSNHLPSSSCSDTAGALLFSKLPHHRGSLLLVRGWQTESVPTPTPTLTTGMAMAARLLLFSSKISLETCTMTFG